LRSIVDDGSKVIQTKEQWDDAVASMPLYYDVVDEEYSKSLIRHGMIGVISKDLVLNRDGKGTKSGEGLLVGTYIELGPFQFADACST
jgi:hypothetical protein